MNTTEERTINTNDLKHGVQFYNTRFAIDKTINDIKKLCKILSIAVPTTLLIYYVFFTVSAVRVDRGLIANIVMLALTATELVLNITSIAKGSFGEFPKYRLTPKKVLHYLKLAVFTVTSVFAIYEAIIFNNSAVKVIGTALMAVAFLARIICEIVSIFAEKYLRLIIEGATRDIEIILDTKLAKGVVAVNDVLSDPAGYIADKTGGLARRIKNIFRRRNEEKSERPIPELLEMSAEDTAPCQEISPQSDEARAYLADHIEGYIAENEKKNKPSDEPKRPKHRLFRK